MGPPIFLFQIQTLVRQTVSVRWTSLSPTRWMGLDVQQPTRATSNRQDDGGGDYTPAQGRDDSDFHQESEVPSQAKRVRLLALAIFTIAWCLIALLPLLYLISRQGGK